MSELSYEASDEASENELLERSLSVWRGWSSIQENFTPIPLDIHTASSIGQYECVRNLINRGEVEIDRKNIGGWTPLMYASYIGHDHIVILLSDRGCNVNHKNQRGHTPLMLAASCGNETVGRTLLRNRAEVEAADRNGWTALFHATYSGHQNFVAFLLEKHANMDAVEPSTGMTPFMEAAVEGHEIIVQLFLHKGVNVNAKSFNGDTARSLALAYGHMKIVSLIDNHVMPHGTLRTEPGLGDYLSSSDEVDKRQRPQHQRGWRAKSKGPSIRDGPEAIARMIDRTRSTDHTRYPNLMVPRGYMSFPHGEGEAGDTQLSYRDVTSPINQEDYRLDSSGGKDSCDYNDDSNAFSKTGAITIKSSSSSSGGLIAALGISRQNSADSDEFRLHDSGVHNSSQSDDNANGEASPRNEARDDGGERPENCGVWEGEAGSETDGDGVLSLAMEQISSQMKEVAADESVCDTDDKMERHGDDREKQSNEADRKEAESLKSIPEDGNDQQESLSMDGNGNSAITAGTAAEKNLEHAFQVQFNDPPIPNLIKHGVTDNSQNVSSRLNQPTPPSQHYTDNFPVDRNVMFDPSNLEDKEAVMDLRATNIPGGVQFAASPGPTSLPPSHMQRRSSCQARLSRLSVADRDTPSQGKEARNRRRSANSPPTFHREYGGRGQDLGSGTGRVSCLSDIPINPGPQAGYPVTSSTSGASQLKGGDGGDRFHGNSQVPVAAVAPTCLPSGGYSSSLTPHPTSAFSTPSLPRKHSAPEISSSDSAHDSNPALATTAVAGYQSDGPPVVGTEARQRLWVGEGSDMGEGGDQCDLETVLQQLGLTKYLSVFEEQDVDLQVFLSLTDNDLKEIGIK
ncbi:hypothetical protein V1264_017212 [Littorina saxatilis]|uniref:SAM domain-containing protein n=2 Tax=Littorina saxatilis TaxID=31220 RepID=A0AAN9GFJ4_9CAEN